MTIINVKSVPVDIIVPKGAFDPKAKNYFGDRLEKAGYDLPVRRGCGRTGIVQGDVRFFASKEPANLKTRFEKNSDGCGVIFSANGIREAMLGMSNDTRGELTRVLTMRVGSCRMRIYSPQQSPVVTVDDLRGKRIETEFPNTLRELMKIWGLSDSDFTLNDTSGADEVAALDGCLAFDITESGNSAREIGYVVNESLPYPDQNTQIIEPASVPFQQITTDGYAWNLQSMAQVQRDKLGAFFYSLEMADRSKSFVSLKFIVPRDRLGEFEASDAFYAPTVAECVGRNDAVELDIWVPADEAAKVTWDLKKKEVQSIGKSLPIQVEPVTSEVWSVFQQFESK